MKLCLITELLEPPFDEGMKIFADAFISAISHISELQVIAVNCSGTEAYHTHVVGTNKLFISLDLKKLIKKLNASHVIYIPAASLTFNSFVRAKILKLYSCCPVAMIGLQPRNYALIAKKIIRLIKPDIIFTQSPISTKCYSEFGMISRLLNPAIDTEKFMPVSKDKQLDIRKKHMVSEDIFLVLHCGHIRRSRNLNILKNLTKIPKVQVIIIASTSTKKDKNLLNELEQAGFIVYQEYIENIAEIYQMADCYVFPVNDHSGAIEMPLSVLEAMACDLPVLCTRFSAVYKVFAHCNGVYFYDNEDEMIRQFSEIRHRRHFSTRDMVKDFTWQSVAQELVNHLTSVAR